MGQNSGSGRGRGAVRRMTLQPDEDVVLVLRPARTVTWPKYLLTLGLYGVWRKRHTFVLTTRRILIGRGILVRTERSIPLDHVDDAVYTRRGLAAYAELTCHGRRTQRLERIGPLSPFGAKRFTHEVLARS
jgi:Bacterial PH domain